MNKIIFFFKNFYYCLDNKNKSKFKFIIFLNFFNAILEFLTIASIIPIIVLLLNKDLEISSQLISILTNTLNEYSASEKIFFFIFLINFIFLIKFIFLYLISKYKIEFLNKLFADISTKVFKTNLFSKYEKLMLSTTPGIVKNIYFESELFVKNIATSFVSLTSEIFKISAILIILLFVNFYAVIFGMLFFGLFSLLFLAVQKSHINKWGQAQIKSYEKMIQFINEGFSSIREIKLMNNKNFFSDKFKFYGDDFISAKIKKELINSIPRPMFELIFIILISVIIIFYLTSFKDTSELIVILGIFGLGFVRLLPSVMKMVNDLQNIFYSYSVVKTIKDKIFEFENLISSEKNLTNSNNEEFFLVDKISKIKMDKISYTYPRSKTQIIKDFSNTFVKGKIYGIFGESGSGKTTLISILMGLLNPTSGKIEVNNKNINLDLSDYKFKICYVPQKILLINDTIKNNITLGMDENKIDEKQLNYAIKMSNLNNFIKNKDLDYILTEEGKNISEGQKQRLGFGRAVYANRDIIFLDEFTSSLDEVNEKILIKNIKLLKDNKLIFIISHKKEIMKICDEIIDINVFK